MVMTLDRMPDNMRNKFLRATIGCLLMVTSASPAIHAVAAADVKEKKSIVKPAASKATPVKLTVDQEDAALSFVQKHHPELASLLKQLKHKSSSGFARGTREVHQAVQRLERFREKQPARFEIELQNWKVDSEIRLLTAKWAISKDPALEENIQALLRKRQQARIDRLKTERDKLAERLAQLDNQIGMGTAELDADLAAEWERLSKRAATTARNQRPRSMKKPSNSRPGNKTIAKPKTEKPN